MYVAQTERDSKFRRIDCADADGQMLPPEAIFRKVKSVVDPYLA